MTSLSRSFAVLALLAPLPALATEVLAQPLVKYLKQQGPVVESKSFHQSAPREQIALYYCVDENLEGGQNAGASNPANVRCEVALFNKSSNWKFADKKSLGQGSVEGFKKGVIEATTITYAASDPLCCPSLSHNVFFQTLDGKLKTQRIKHKK